MTTRNDTALDLFYLLPDQRILVCRACKAGVVPQHLVTHIRAHYRRLYPDFGTKRSTVEWVKNRLLTSLPCELLDPLVESIPVPPSDTKAFPILKLHVGYGCTHCPIVSKREEEIRRHYNICHAEVRRGRGGAVANSRGIMQKRLNSEHYGDQPPCQPAFYQRFFTAGVKGSICFRVKAPEKETEDATLRQQSSVSRSDEGDFVMGQVFGALARLETTQSGEQLTLDTELATTQVSPWLERTRWLHYLKGISLDRAAGLARLPNQHDEPVLYEVGLAVDRLVEAAYMSLCEEKVNFFGQKRIASFLPRTEVYSRPLVYKLKESTYKQYKQLWKRALAFICRTCDPEQDIQFQHALGSCQTALFDSLLGIAARKVAQPSSAPEQLDRICLDFCLSLLEQPIRGNVFESPLVGFLAVLGIDENNNTLYEAPNYTPKLSAFIKIAQLLVLQKAVLLAEDGVVQDPLDPLDEMRNRFMTLENATPFTWAVHLRSFGKRIRDCTTSLGYMRWSEDGQTINYREIELQIPVFKRFAMEQVHATQQSLEALFLLDADESRAEVIPRLALDRLRDDPTNVTRGWSFLKDRRNTDILPPSETWLLRRVIRTDGLRDRFCALNSGRNIT
jgi:hypothetical protein